MNPVAKRVLQITIGAALLGGGGWFVRARTKGEARAAGGKDAAASAVADRIVPVVVAKVTQRDVPVYLDGLGNVSAFATVTVRTQVEGRLDKVLFREGQEVKEG